MQQQLPRLLLRLLEVLQPRTGLRRLATLLLRLRSRVSTMELLQVLQPTMELRSTERMVPVTPLPFSRVDWVG